MPGPSRLVRIVLAVLALLAAPALLPALAGSAHATAPGLQVHHLVPADGAVLAAAPDHVEIMFDREPAPGGVDVGIAPDDTGRLVPLPGRPAVDGPVVVQRLPALAPGRYTVGVQVVDRAGHLARGTFGFTVDPSAGPAGADPAGSGPGRSGPGPSDLTWIVPAAAAALLLPALLTARRRARR